MRYAGTGGEHIWRHGTYVMSKSNTTPSRITRPLAATELERITESCTAMVRAFGITAAQAASVFAAFSAGINALNKEVAASPPTEKKASRPWYRRGRW